ncbi:hypothetical protein yinte0001_26010 [Yersinia intermedia ATCC 29909]|nr:hypothetical protein yinte0001_26010 [Yersinia intermedia ATCC 29909]
MNVGLLGSVGESDTSGSCWLWLSIFDDVTAFSFLSAWADSATL